MPPKRLPPRSDAEHDDSSDPINVMHVLDRLGFFLRAAKRRWLLTAALLLIGALVTASAAHLAPRSFRAETKILAQRQVPIPLLTTAQHAEPVDVDGPVRAARETRATSEAILRRDNLLAIVDETKLGERWDLGRSPIQRLFSALRRTASAPDSDEDIRRALVRVLEKRISVKTDDATITLSVSWHHPEVAREILACVLGHFLRDIGAVETAAPAEAIGILEGQAARQREAIDAALAAAEEAHRSAAQTELGSRRRSGAEARALAADDTRITTLLDDKRRAVQAAEDTRQRQLTELLAQLDRLRSMYTSGHPAVVAMEERIRSARSEPADITARKKDEEAILARLKGLGPRADSNDPIGALEQPRVTATRIKLAAAVNKYEELLGRLDAARLQREAARATFKHRYVVTEPPELPGKPEKPVVLIVILVGALLTMATMLSVPGMTELARGRFVESSQVRRNLPLPLLAEVEAP